MKKPTGLSVVLLLVSAGVASAQSLGDVARKERERREANAVEGRTAVVAASGTGESFSRETSDDAFASDRVRALEQELRQANEKLDELLERTSAEAPEEPVEPRPPAPTARERADDFERQMLEIRRSYSEVLGRCLGGSWTTVYGETIGYSGDTASCYLAEEMRAEYESLYRKIWAIEGASILKRNLPKRLDPNRA